VPEEDWNEDDGQIGLRVARIRESNEKMSVDEIAGRLQTCAFNETSVPGL